MPTRERRRAPQHADTLPVRWVIGFVGGALLLAMVQDAYLVYMGKPPANQTVIIQCITGLLALLAKTSASTPAGTPQEPLTVQAPPNEPVKVDVKDGE